MQQKNIIYSMYSILLVTEDLGDLVMVEPPMLHPLLQQHQSSILYPWLLACSIHLLSMLLDKFMHGVKAPMANVFD